jgi:hypothetical protein
MARNQRSVITEKQINIGDLINVEYLIGDLNKSQGGRVRRRDRGSHCIEYITERGYVMLTVFRSGETNPPNIQQIVLLDRVDMSSTALPGLEELYKEVLPPFKNNVLGEIENV